MKNAKSKPLRLMRLIDEVDPKWMAQFGEYARTCRQEQPIPAKTALSPLEQAQQVIVADWLQSWMARNPNVFTPRAYTYTGMFAGQKNVIKMAVFTSNMPGLVAAQEYFTSPPATLRLLLDTEYAKWMKPNPQDYLKSHWRFFCEFRPIHSSRFDVYNVECNPNLDYWEQHSGAMYGGLHGIGEYILWQWDGETASKASRTELTWQS